MKFSNLKVWVQKNTFTTKKSLKFCFVLSFRPVDITRICAECWENILSATFPRSVREHSVHAPFTYERLLHARGVRRTNLDKVSCSWEELTKWTVARWLQTTACWRHHVSHVHRVNSHFLRGVEDCNGYFSKRGGVMVNGRHGQWPQSVDCPLKAAQTNTAREGDRERAKARIERVCVRGGDTCLSIQAFSDNHQMLLVTGRC